MSYRDPKIIVDRSAEIYAQGANQLGQTMGKFVDDTFKIKLEETGLRIKQINAIGQWAQAERDKSDIVIAKNAAKVAPGLSEQYIDMQTKDYNELIKRSVKAKIDPTSTSREERDWIQKQSIRLKTDGAVIEKMRVQNELNVQEANENVSDGAAHPDTVWNSVEDRLSYAALNGKVSDGIKHKKSWFRGAENQLLYKIDSTIDSNTALGKKIIEAWGLKTDKDGIAIVSQDGDPANLKSPLTAVPSKVEYEKNDIIGYQKNGKLVDKAFFEHNTISKKDINGNTVTSHNGIFDIAGYTTAVTDGMNAEAFSIVQSTPTVGQLAYINSRIPLSNGNLMTKKVWEEEYPDVKDKVKYIEDRLIEDNIKFAKNQLRNRNATAEEIENGIADVEGQVWYDPTVAKIVEDTDSGMLGGKTVKERNIIRQNIISLIKAEDGKLQGKTWYTFTFKGSNDVNTRKYRIRPILGNTTHVMSEQANYDGSFKGVKGVLTSIADINKELGSKI